MSARFTLDKKDFKKILRGAAVAAVGVILTGTTELVLKTDLGNWTPYVVAGWSVVANAVRKWISNEPETGSKSKDVLEFPPQDVKKP